MTLAPTFAADSPGVCDIICEMKHSFCARLPSFYNPYLKGTKNCTACTSTASSEKSAVPH